MDSIKKKTSWSEEFFCHRHEKTFYMHHFHDSLEVGINPGVTIGASVTLADEEHTLRVSLGLIFFTLFFALNLSRVNDWIRKLGILSYHRRFSFFVNTSGIELAFMEGDNTMNTYVARSKNLLRWRVFRSLCMDHPRTGHFYDGFRWEYYWVQLLGRWQDEVVTVTKPKTVSVPIKPTHTRSGGDFIFEYVTTHSTTGRRFGKKTKDTRVDLKCLSPEGPSYSGKGENSWDQDDCHYVDASFCLSEDAWKLPSEYTITLHVQQAVNGLRGKHG